MAQATEVAALLCEWHQKGAGVWGRKVLSWFWSRRLSHARETGSGLGLDSGASSASEWAEWKAASYIHTLAAFLCSVVEVQVEVQGVKGIHAHCGI